MIANSLRNLNTGWGAFVRRFSVANGLDGERLEFWGHVAERGFDAFSVF
jgi:hypothetical protein